ncbi:uncharacterized protein LOC114352327 [Ostrinia furnacalis]|uniref:uncharacterized protein LOC114352327 n=1 Tax=Ostrinia furnacalis TaxID=93504 RepID=UPI00103E6624|nr:uncharacterized protein LOC114352327 [Ostrinia furnacalis]
MEPLEDENCQDVFENNDQIFESDEEMKASLKNLCYGDLCMIGKIWIQALKVVLVGAKFSLIPVVHAAKPPEPPKKPPKMKYKDLPIYSSPHYDYKDYVESKDKCPDRNVKLVHRALLPHVKSLRQKSIEAYCSACCSLRCTFGDMRNSINDSKREFKKTMRDPCNLQMRRGVVAAGTLAGYLLGGGGGIPRRAFFTSLGALATGSLCFPKETDEIFRNVAYHTAKVALTLYNATCRKDFALRERLPCKDELPPEPKPRKPVCPPKK